MLCCLALGWVGLRPAALCSTALCVVAFCCVELTELCRFFEFANLEISNEISITSEISGLSDLRSQMSSDMRSEISQLSRDFISRRFSKRIHGCMYVRMGAQVGGWIQGWMDGWVGGWMDGWVGV